MIVCQKKKMHFFLSCNVFSTKVLIGDTIYTSPTGEGTAISTWSSEPGEGPATCSAKTVPSFFRYFKTLVRPRESNPRPPALQSSALLTEHPVLQLLLCPLFLVERSDNWKYVCSRRLAVCARLLHFLVKKREFQTFIFLSVCSRTARNFTFLLTLVWQFFLLSLFFI